MPRIGFSKWDIIPIVAVLVLAALVLLLFLPSGEPAAYVEIYQNGQLVKTLSLTEDGTYTVEGKYTNVITVQGGKVAITESDCPGGDCRACGWFGTSGSIVCLPNGVEVRVISKAADVDVVVG